MSTWHSTTHRKWAPTLTCTFSCWSTAWLRCLTATPTVTQALRLLTAWPRCQPSSGRPLPTAAAWSPVRSSSWQHCSSKSPCCCSRSSSHSLARQQQVRAGWCPACRSSCSSSPCCSSDGSAGWLQAEGGRNTGANLSCQQLCWCEFGVDMWAARLAHRLHAWLAASPCRLVCSSVVAWHLVGAIQSHMRHAGAAELSECCRRRPSCRGRLMLSLLPAAVVLPFPYSNWAGSEESRHACAHACVLLGCMCVLCNRLAAPAGMLARAGVRLVVSSRHSWCGPGCVSGVSA